MDSNFYPTYNHPDSTFCSSFKVNLDVEHLNSIKNFSLYLSHMAVKKRTNISLVELSGERERERERLNGGEKTTKWIAKTKKNVEFKC